MKDESEASLSSFAPGDDEVEEQRAECSSSDIVIDKEIPVTHVTLESWFQSKPVTASYPEIPPCAPDSVERPVTRGGTRGGNRPSTRGEPLFDNEERPGTRSNRLAAPNNPLRNSNAGA
eukprot:395601-Pyramimonas_sp.AAC.1